MAGKPLIYYSIKACIDSPRVNTVVVSTDDEEIALFAGRFGAEVLIRPDYLADDIQTLDPVILHALEHCEATLEASYDIVLTVQPTSPLISPSEIDQALAMLNDGDLETVLSVVDDRHLSWTMADGKAIPAYTDRVNRQFLAPRFRETGAIIGCLKSVLLDRQTRIGDKVGLLEIEQEKSFDIDTISDFMLCESLMQRKTIVFNVIGNQSVGMGHVYRTLMLANELVGHRLIFVCQQKDSLASQFIGSKNFQVISSGIEDNVEAVLSFKPDLVINDVLDTQSGFVLALKKFGAAVINFEDLGPGIEHADLVVNALYPATLKNSKVKTGPEYFCLREEFVHPPIFGATPDAPDVLLCFGGVDQSNLTARVFRTIHPLCVALRMRITIVLGAGYIHHQALNTLISRNENTSVEIVKTTSAISDYMRRSKLAITSGGRTVFELAALRIPTIVICQNEREQTHNFTDNRSGILNLGLHENLEDAEIGAAFQRIAGDDEKLASMTADLAKSDFSSGKQRVMALIREVIESSND